MPGKFCFICGKKTDDLVDGLCEECHAANQELVKLPDKIEIIVCPRCNRMTIGNKQADLDLAKFLRYKAKKRGKIVHFTVSEGKNKRYKIKVMGYPRGMAKMKEEHHEIGIHFNKRMCMDCAKASGGYYEAIIQLRFKEEKSRLKQWDVVEEIKEMVRMQDTYAFIEEKKEGVNFKVGRKRAAKKITEQIRRRHDAEIKYTRKLITKKDGKDVFRDTYSVRI